MRDMKPSLIARVTVNTTVTWLRKTVSRYSGAFSIIVQMYAEYKFLSISEKNITVCASIGMQAKSACRVITKTVGAMGWRRCSGIVSSLNLRICIFHLHWIAVSGILRGHLRYSLTTSRNVGYDQRKRNLCTACRQMELRN